MRTRHGMRRARSGLLPAALLLAGIGLAAAPAPAAAQDLPTPTCAWPLLWTPVGLGNWIFPDTAYRLWYIPIDRDWRTVTLNGTYPKARFFSLALYDNAPVATGLADHLYDAEITPDPGAGNPFASAPPAAGGPQTYTVTITRGDEAGENLLHLHADTGWLLYRIYLPNTGAGGMGAVPLPQISVTRTNGERAALPVCDYVNRRSEILAVQSAIVPDVFETPPRTPPVPDRIWFGPLKNPPVRLLPNPDNKYMVSFFMSEDRPDRVIVIRARMPGFPDTLKGAPVSQPAPGFDAIELRYWTMCVGEVVSPLPLTSCTVDAATPLDDDGFATLVITSDVVRPPSLDPNIVWLPYGDGQMVPKTIFMRYLLPSPDFPHSIQQAVSRGCGAEWQFPTPPSNAALTEAGQCTREVMGDYYPLAAWCDAATFDAAGWKGCFEKAGID
ncbi:hypothetical protein [Acuticoccus kandeliae]|uniref:hypothetical protein n=1 Tax=Acuticoccus kandeliae TaxID=2073160 RepID=UPI00196A8B84|nr:hypothetical protein [Acuticoccus kandeliae]